MRPETKIHTVVAILMSFAMASLFSGYFAWLNLGFTPAWIKAWGHNLLRAWPIGFVAALLLGYPIRVLATQLVAGAAR
jgi:hypothetical protein